MTRKAYINPELEATIVDLEKSFQKSFRSIAARLRRLIKELRAGGGVTVSDAVLAQKVRAMIFELENEIDRSGFKSILSQTRRAIQTMSSVILAEAGALGLDDAFSKDELEQIKLLTTGAHRRLLLHRHRAASELEEVLVRSATGNVEWEDTIQAISGKLSITETQATTEAEKIVAAFHTKTRVDHAVKNDVDWFQYMGPMDLKTRNWCSHFVGTRVTISILEKHKGRFVRKPDLVPVYAYLGGYNCRHELVPLPEGSRDEWEKLPVGPK